MGLGAINKRIKCFVNVLIENIERITFIIISLLLIFIIFLLYAPIQIKEANKNLVIEADNEKNSEVKNVNNDAADAAQIKQNELINGKYNSLQERDATFQYFSSLIYSNNSIVNYNDKEIKQIIDEVKDTTQLKIQNILRDVTAIGDSYCGYMSEYIYEKYNYALSGNAVAGKTVIDNMELYLEEINKSNKNIIVLTTSVNDVLEQTELIVFKAAIETLYKAAYDKKKIFVVMSYCDFSINNQSANLTTEYEYVPKYYDALIARSATYYSNVLYINMNDLAVPKNNRDNDTIHYNDYFYEQFLNRIVEALRSA